MPEAATVSEAVINQLAYDIHSNAMVKGFWEPPQDLLLAEVNTKLMLIVSEVAEAQEVIRNRYTDDLENPFSQMTPEQEHEFLLELADIIIRTFDLAQYFGWNIGEALLTKMETNAARPHKHNKRF